MKWKTKAFLQSVLSQIPLGDKIYFALQRQYGGFRNFNVTSKVDQGIRILEILEENQIYLKNKRICEIGTGWVPVIPTILFIFGQESCVTFDVQRLLQPKLFIDSLNKISRLTNHFHNKIPWAWNYEAENRLKTITDAIPDQQEIFNMMRLEYKAPVNQTFQDISPNSIDILVSNTTLEHIPKNDLEELLIASKRVLRSEGMAVHLIDCSDHFSHNDRSISRINFLRYTENEWQRYNSKFIYQNRLRASDYQKLFENCGFEIVSCKPKIPNNLRTLIIDFPIALDYQQYNHEDLITTEIEIVARVQK